MGTTTTKTPAPTEPRHVARKLISLTSFAKLKGVSRHAVYYHVNTSKQIIPTLVGMDKDIYIDWKTYENFVFNELKTGSHTKEN
jgi:hypothetical protein